MSTGRLRAAVIGCGRIAGGYAGTAGPVTTHAQAYARDPATQLVGACDPDPSARKRFGARWHVPVYETAAALLEQARPDLVSICSPNRCHADDVVLTLAHAAAPQGVLAEKPLCTSPAELARVEAALSARRAGGLAGPVVLVNHTRRFDAAHRRVAAAARAGDYGRLLGGRMDYYGGWLHNATHLVDLLRMVCGDVAVVRVSPGAPGREECPDVELRVAGAPVTLHGFDESRYQLFEVDLRFEDARVLFEDFGAVIRVQPRTVNAHGERYLDVPAEERMAGLQEPLTDAVTTMVSAVSGTGTVDGRGATLDEASATMRVMWEALAVCRS